MRYEIVQDCDSCNPRTEWDNAGKLVCWGREVTGDENPRVSPCEWLREFAASLVDAENPDLINVDAILAKHCVILPVYAYIHGGIVLNTGGFSCPWDSGQVGWIYATMDTVRKEWSGDREACERCLRAEIEEYSQYLAGDVWGYRVFDGDCEIDSCWGFYGYDYCESEAKAAMEACEAIPMAGSGI